MTNRQQAIRIVNRVCFQTCGLVLNDLPDLPSIMYAIDEMEEIIACEGETASIAELEDIAQEAVMELLEEEGMDELYV